MQMRGAIRVIVAMYVNLFPDDPSDHIRSEQDKHRTHHELEHECQVFWNGETQQQCGTSKHQQSECVTHSPSCPLVEAVP